MKYVIEACLLGWIIFCSAGYAQTPVLKQGVHVEMPSASHAVEMKAADGQNATVVAITASGKVFVGIEPTEPAALNKLSAGTVYVKADSRASFQSLVAVLDGLRGKSVVLLTAPPENPARQGYVSPYGMKLSVSK